MMSLKQKFLIIAGVCFFAISAKMEAQQIVKLWSGNPPTHNGITKPEKVERDGGWVGAVSEAEISIYLPPKDINTGLAVLICPGGGYSGLAIGHEGADLAKWLNTKGIAGIVLKYRMPNGHNEVPLDDAWQAMRYLRSNADSLAINPAKIGIAGASAGGHLAATTSVYTAQGEVNTRPDFSILFYPVITMKTLTHGGSRANLLGNNPSEADILRYSCEDHVSATTPPTILLLSSDDESVSSINSVDYYQALKRNNIPATMYIFPEGGHGWGMRESFKYHTQMLDLLSMWLDDIKKK